MTGFGTESNIHTSSSWKLIRTLVSVFSLVKKWQVELPIMNLLLVMEITNFVLKENRIDIQKVTFWIHIKWIGSWCVSNTYSHFSRPFEVLWFLRNRKKRYIIYLVFFFSTHLLRFPRDRLDFRITLKLESSRPSFVKTLEIFQLPFLEAKTNANFPHGCLKIC